MSFSVLEQVVLSYTLGFYCSSSRKSGKSYLHGNFRMPSCVLKLVMNLGNKTVSVNSMSMRVYNTKPQWRN
jgi:hypothetical protein